MVPGTAFGSMGNIMFVQVSLHHKHKLVEAADRIERFVETLHSEVEKESA